MTAAKPKDTAEIVMADLRLLRKILRQAILRKIDICNVSFDRLRANGFRVTVRGELVEPQTEY